MSELIDLTNRLAAETLAFRKLAAEAAVAEATYKREWAKRFLMSREEAKTNDERKAVVDSDEHVAQLAMTRLTSAAVADSQKEVLRSLREHIGAVRTEMANHRVGDELHARGYGGAA